MAKMKVWQSVEDVIDILDSAPIHRDLFGYGNVQLANRVPVAHLAIERSIKALVADVAGTFDSTHSLHELYQSLKKHDQASARFLAYVFQDAVVFYGYNTNAPDFRHLRTIDDYLSKTGNQNAFDAFRYLVIDENPKGGDPTRYVFLMLHRELLCAQVSLLGWAPKQTVSQRVETRLNDALFRHRRISISSGDPELKISSDWYHNWLFDVHTTRRDALQDAVSMKFKISDDELIEQTLIDAYEELKQEKIPRFNISLLSSLSCQRGHKSATQMLSHGWNGSTLRKRVAWSKHLLETT